MTANWQIPRRTFLRGVGAAVALPLLDAMVPVARAAEANNNDAPPKRMAFLYVPNGAHMVEWTPEATGDAYAMPKILEPLEPLRKDLLVLTNLAQQKANSNGDGPGDHARSNATFLTGMQAHKTSGKDIRIGVSVDQFAAQQIGQATRFPSLEMGCEGGGQAGNCDSGYSCAYSSNLSWSNESTPVPKEVNPRAVFDRLFGASKPDEVRVNLAARERYRKSILDFVMEDAQRLQKNLGQTDRRKLDEYLTAVRSVEQRIGKSGGDFDKDAPPELIRPQGVPRTFAEHARLLGDLMVLAFQADLTRICTFAFANDGSNRSYSEIEVSAGHHDLSHHGRNEEKQEKIAKINRFHIEQFAYILHKLKAVKEGDGTLLDHSMIVYGSGISDGDRHNHNELPVLLAGHGGGTLKPGRHIKYDNDTPLMNLYLAMFERMGVKCDTLGDSNGRLGQLEG